VDAFDADVLIYAAAPSHPLGRRVAALLIAGSEAQSDIDELGLAGVGSLALVTEVLSKPIQANRSEELALLTYYLTRLDLLPVNPVTADAAAIIGARYGLKAIDAIHLATAILVGADRFITNNRRDFKTSVIREIAITYPEDLPEPAAA
jgi:predicted nucleic acid-binding protein